MYGEAMTNANHSQDELSWKNLKALLKKQGIEAHADGIGNTRFSYKDGDENIFLGGYIDMPDEEYMIATRWFVNGKRNPHRNKWDIIADELRVIKYPSAYHFSEQKFFRGS